jgi:heme exporter protein D
MGAPLSWRAKDMMEAFALGGYGGYVWGSYGVAALALGIELALLRARWRRAVRRARQEHPDAA